MLKYYIMNIDLNLLSCFQVVAEKGSASKASSILHLSQPTISLQLKRLEEQLGMKLFERESRGLRLTQYGKDLLVHARRLAELKTDVSDLVKGSRTEPKGPLRIGTYTTISSYLVAVPTANYLRQFSEVKLQYSYDTVEVLLERVLCGDLDGAVLSDVPKRASLKSDSLFEDELIYAVSSKLKITSTITPQQLVEIPFLSYPLRFDFCYQKVERYFGSYLAKAAIPVEATSFDTLKQMLLLGAGGCFIPKYLIRNELDSGLLKEIKIGKQRLPIQFYFVSLGKESLSVAASAYREAIISYFKKSN